MSVLIFILVLVVLILVHEFGHFMVAKWVGMRVDEFGIGYPPRALSLGKIGETEYTLNWIPFGGFVKIFGEDGGGDDPRAFSKKTRGVQALVLVAGVAMNVLFAWIIFTGLLMVPHMISSDTIAAPLPLGPALVRGAHIAENVVVLTASGLAHFFGGIVTFSANLGQVSGPLGIASAVGSASKSGIESLLTLTALISINLAIINLIPIPALDGGRLLFVILEAVFRRRIPAAVAQKVNMVGFAFLLLLMVVVTAHDIFKLVG